MDIGLYREEEQFSFSSSPNTEAYSSDISSFEGFEQSEFFDQILPEPPINMFEWNNESDIGVSITNTNKEDVADIAETLCTPLENTDLDTLDSPLWQNGQWPFVKQENVDWDDILALPEFSNLEFMNVIKSEPISDDRIRECISDTLIDDNESTLSESSDPLNVSTEITNFDIAEYIFEENKQSKQSTSQCPSSKVQNKRRETESGLRGKKRPAVKKIDRQACKYIIDNGKRKKCSSVSDDECDVDIETVSEGENETVLEAGDLASLLEKFEAAENKHNGSQCEKMINLKVRVELSPPKSSRDWTKQVRKPGTDAKLSSSASNRQKHKTTGPPNTTRNGNKDKRPVKKEKTGKEKPRQPPVPTKTEPAKTKPLPNGKSKPITSKPENTSSKTNSKPPIVSSTNKKTELRNKVAVVTKTKPVINQTTANVRATTSSPINNGCLHNKPLSKELIERIKGTGKRKPITLIQPIPNKKFKNNNKEPPKVAKAKDSGKSDIVRLDHNYCSVTSLSRKDSGIGSEEDDRTVISRQPTVKNADGTLMVSLLKANTIHHHIEPVSNKKKLNLEEYKKRRRELVIPTSSPTCNDSSSKQEDEKQKIRSHQEKLKKMAQQVLNAAPKSENKPDRVKSVTRSPDKRADSVPDMAIKKEGLVKLEPLVREPVPVKLKPPVTPSVHEEKMRRIELVSFGVNTDFDIAQDLKALRPAATLAEIKPLLEKASGIINDNSLISSVIQNIPKMIDRNVRTQNSHVSSGPSLVTHGEDKHVYYLEKGRECSTRSVSIQTNLSLVGQLNRCRERTRKRKLSCSSATSYNSRVSRRQNYVRSSSRSPQYKWRKKSMDREHLNAVEERRIIYLGRVMTGTTKDDLRRKFEKFGPITRISLHFRELGYKHLENYGFVTFRYKEDAHQAYEHGNDDDLYPFYKISFGGRRVFCQSTYSDLDNMRDESYYHSKKNGDSYDRMLEDTLAKIRNRHA